MDAGEAGAEIGNAKASDSRIGRPGQGSQSFRLVSVTSGRDCIGHVVCRGKLGFEGFNAADESIGVFPTLKDAANAVTDADDGGEAAS